MIERVSRQIPVQQPAASQRAQQGGGFGGLFQQELRDGDNIRIEEEM